VTTSSTNVSCAGNCDGTANATGMGGTAPYTYAWTNGDVTSNADSLCPGNYTVTITDANGCVTAEDVTITEPVVLALTLNATDVTCFGSCDGTASGSATGGTAPYAYSWNTGVNNDSLSALCPGTYTLTVSDANGCIATQTITVSEPAQLVANLMGNNISCNGACDGSAVTNAQGGIAPYTYLWNTGSTATTLSGVCPGTYSVVITDANGCVHTDSVMLTEPMPLTVALSEVNVMCAGQCDGSTNAMPAGGTAPYNYLWSNGDTIANPTGLCAGTYGVTVTDANGCVVSDQIIVEEPSQIVLNPTIDGIPCHGGCKGEITLAPMGGGGAPYTYNWATGDTTSSIGDLCAGNYVVTVTDVDGCSVTDTIVLTEPAPLMVNFSVDSATCSTTCDGAATAHVTGGVAPYAFNWFGFGVPIPNDSIKQNLCPTNYMVAVHDANGCAQFLPVTVASPVPVEVQLSIDEACHDVCDGEISATVINGTAPYLFTYNGVPGGATETGLCEGTYMVDVLDANGCIGSTTQVLGEHDEVTMTLSGTASSSSCQNQATAQGDDGTAPFPATGEMQTGLCDGSYNVTVTDANGCVADSCIAFAGGSVDYGCDGNFTIQSVHSHNQISRNDGRGKVFNQNGVTSTLRTKLAPNPTRYSTKVSIIADTDHPKVGVYLCDMTGRIITAVYEGPVGELQTKSIEVSTADLSAGMYIIETISDGRREVQRLLVE